MKYLRRNYTESRLAHTLGVFLLLPLLLGACASGQVEPSNEDKRASIYFYSGIKAIREAKFAHAIKAFRQTLQIQPENAEAWNHLGVAYHYKKSKELAERALHKALAVDPKFTDAHNNLGVLYLRSNQLDKAEFHFKQAIADLEYTGSYRAKFNLALVYLKQNKSKQALPLLVQSTKENKSFCSAWFKLGEVAQSLAKKQLAMEALERASSGICYGHVEAHYRLGLSLLEMQDYDGAHKKFQEILDRFPQSNWADLASKRLKGSMRR